MPVATPKAQPSLRVIRPKVALAAASAPAAPVVPAWNFPNLNGTYTIDASTNLVDWQTVAVVYDAKSLNLSSDTTQKRTVIFYRITPSF